MSFASWKTPRSGREVLVSQDAQGAFWLFAGSVGEVRLTGQVGLIEAWPSPRVRPRQFIETLFLEWLPAIYSFSGWSVLRASSIWRIGSSSAVAFAGDRGCGKSTLARAIGSRPGWGQLSDDTLAFDMLDAYPQLLPMPNRVQLEPPTADRLDHDPSDPKDLEWPTSTLQLEAIYLLRETDALASRAEVRPVNLTDAGDALIRPARRLALPDASLLSDLSEAIRNLVASVRVFELTYSKNVAQLRSLTNGVAQHALGIIQQAEELRAQAAELSTIQSPQSATSNHAA